uniref:Uncharacterized protein n=1 Tax=uncultured bacterium pAB2 TaxID=1448270 RepID=W5VRK6_9BACT|nr:hypothetical protein [uncultured bacterium pAB2]
MPAYGRWLARRPVGLTRPAQLLEQPRKEFAEKGGNEPTCPVCDPAIVHFPGALPDGGRSWAETVPMQCRDHTRTAPPSP